MRRVRSSLLESSGTTGKSHSSEKIPSVSPANGSVPREVKEILEDGLVGTVVGTRTGEADNKNIGYESESTLTCILTGEELIDPENKILKTQREMLTQLNFATLSFSTLAVARTIDSLQDLSDDLRASVESNEGTMVNAVVSAASATASSSGVEKYTDVVTLVSAVDPLLVGVFAYATKTALQKALDKEARNEESLEEMRQEAMESLVVFFERANFVVLGVAFASFSRVLIKLLSSPASTEYLNYIGFPEYVDAAVGFLERFKNALPFLSEL